MLDLVDGVNPSKGRLRAPKGNGTMRLLSRLARRQRRQRKSLFNRTLDHESLEHRLVLASLQHESAAAIIGQSAPAPISPRWFATVEAEVGSAELMAGRATVLPLQHEWVAQISPAALAQLQSVADAVPLFVDSQAEVIRGLGQPGQILLRSTSDPDLVEEWLRGSSAVASFERNATLALSRTPNDISFSQLWGLHNTGQTGGTADADIDAPEAWDLLTGGPSIVVGVIDTGVDYNHPDLVANIWTNPGEIPGNFLDDDNNGFVDDVHGYDFYNNDSNPMDDNFHGTHVAGTIAGVGNNSVGVAGVNWSSSIMALKFLNSGGNGYTADAVRAVNYATMMKTNYGVNIRLTNNSWGGGGYSQALYDAIALQNAAGMLFVAAAGNDSLNNDSYASYPASYTLNNIISVAATDHRDTLAYFSNYGQTTVDLAAPGVDIYSTSPGSSYMTLSGTSMASPHVAGVAALAWTYSPTSSATEIRQAILGGVDRIAGLNGIVATGGRLNARNTLMQLGMNVMSSTPGKNAIVTTPPTAITIDFTHPYVAASVQASDLTLNNAPATSWTAVDIDTITFQFATSPVTIPGVQTLRIAAGNIVRQSDNDANDAWESTFLYDSLLLGLQSSTPAQDAVVLAPPTQLVLVFNEPISLASVQASDLKLDFGTATGVTHLSDRSVAFAIGGLIRDGVVNYSLPAGSILDAIGIPNVKIDGRFVIDDPLTQRYDSTDVPKPIADLSTVTSVLNILTPLTIADLDVELSILHPNAADLDVFLIAPDGTRVELFTDVGGSGDNFTSTILDDAAANSITTGVAPFTGRYRAEGALSVLNGYNAQGTWKLEVTDDSGNFTGSIVDWGLRIATDVNISPRISSVQPLPADGGATWAPINNLSVRFSEVMDATTVNQLANWSLVEAGADRLFGTPDDTTVALALATPYTNSLTANFNLPAMLTPGNYRLSAAPALRDITGNLLDGNADGTGGDAFTRTFTVRPHVSALPFQESFEAGSVAALGGYWEFAASSTGRASVVSSSLPNSGSYHLLLDETDTYAGTQHAILHLNLVGQSGLTLDFWQKEFGNVYEGTDDRVQISPDGVTWYTVVSLTGVNSQNYYQHHSFNLDAAIAAAGFTYTSNFQIRFSQDNYFYSFGGFAFDDIRVSQLDASGPRILSQSPTTAQTNSSLASFTVTFSEAIDPASFTAADVTLIDPAGGTVVLQGDPIASADQKTFTIQPSSALSVVGTYQLRIGPGVTDLVGNLMNQDNDNLSGEASDFYTGSLLIGPAVPQPFPYVQGFEGGNLALAGWRFAATSGVIDATSDSDPYGGSQQLRMTGSSTREAVLVLNMSSLVGATNLYLDFWLKNIASTGSTLTVQVSANGTSFFTIANGSSLQGTVVDTFEHFAFDLDAALAAASVAHDGDVYIKFRHSGSSATSALTIDDLRFGTTDVVGPRVTSLTSNGTGAVTVVFNEAIDPAYFTASQISIVGPTGYPLALSGTPVASADRKTFTLQVPAIAGTSRVIIGTNVRDDAGNLLNQNSDGIMGGSGDAYSSTFTISSVPQAFPYSQGFESGSLTTLPGWSFTSDDATFIDAVSTNGPIGASHLRFNNTASGTQTATLALNLASQVGATNLTLDFWVQSLTRLTSSNSLRVEVNGSNSTSGWWTVDSFVMSSALGQYTRVGFDLDAALSGKVTIDSDVYIRFSHSGGAADQFTIDDVRVSNVDVLGPRVTGQTFAAGNLAITFDEPIDPASFSAADIQILGPVGAAVPYFGTPVPSADNRTFTLSIANSANGPHTFKLGPDIRDTAGNLMNQDGDEISGEAADNYSGSFTIGPPVPQMVPYFETFEGGSWQALPGWTFSVSADATIELTGANNPRGGAHLKFDQLNSGLHYSTLALNLASQVGRNDLTLDFWMQSLGSLATLEIRASGDGNNFVSLPTDTLQTPPGQYVRYAFDLDAALAAAGIVLDSGVYLQFVHLGGSATQELTLDDVRVSNIDLLGPVFASSTANGNQFTITFSEPMDPSSFTAGDLAITGPLGAAVPIVGAPVASADQRSFTITLGSSVVGDYSFRLGPDIRDLASNLMNQDGDGLPGEAIVDAYNGTFKVGPPTAVTLPYAQGFESGDFANLPGWSFSASAGKLGLTGGVPHQGSFHLAFGPATTNAQQATLLLDLTAQATSTDLTLDFWAKSLAASQSNSLTVSVSGDGDNWFAIALANPLAITATTDAYYAFDLDAALASFGIALDSSVYVRFAHAGVGSMAAIAIDDVRIGVRDLQGPSITSHQAQSATNSFTVTFNEPIDPATFTAADVNVTGPLGYAAPTVGNPVPAADNRTFTIQLAGQLSGAYTFIVGPDIRDIAGNAMNQDGDLVAGETNGQDDYDGVVQIGVTTPQSFPYEQGFESFPATGIPGWRFGTTGTGKIDVITSDSPHGGLAQLRFDQTSLSTQHAILALDLSSQVGATNLSLDFWLKSLNTSSSNWLTLAVSGNGSDWTNVAVQFSPPTVGVFAHFAYDLDAVLATAGVAADDSVFIRFTHEGSTSSAKMLLDDVRVSTADVFGSRVTTFTAAAGQVLVTFDEPIDVATFTRDDIVLTGPTGTVIPLTADPVASGDNRSFTIAIPAAVPGTYTMRLGPDVRDVAGNWMNQDNDVFTGESSDFYTGTFTIAAAAQAFPYVQDFEAGQFGLLPGLSFSTTNTGTLELVSTNSPRGNYHLKFDQTSSSTQSVVLLLDLSNQIGSTNLTLDFWAQALNSSTSLNVQVSGNGVSYYSLSSTSPPVGKYQHYAFDLDARLATAGVALDSDVYIRLTRTGSTSTQELTIDDLRVSSADPFGPRVIATAPTAAANSFTVTFDKSIDSAAFTAADVILKGPTGYAASLIGDPVPSADARTFTLTVAAPITGAYTIQIGPEVFDLAGNPMNQDNDELIGETTDYYSGSVQLGKPVPQAFPLVEGFESGSFEQLPGWSFSTTSTATNDLTTANNPHGGSYHLKFDQTSSGTNRADVAINLSGRANDTNLVLDFWLQSTGTNLGGDSLYIYLSGDGLNYFTFTAGIGLSPPALNQQTHFALDLDAALKSTNVAIDGDVYVRFERSSFGSTYEMTLDDIRISNLDQFGPRITSQAITGEKTISVTFDEAIDPSTFTAADVVITGPHGLAIPLVGNPQPSADQRTFTLTLATTVAGTNKLVIGPDVRDLAGNLMNQDNDAVSGEPLVDDYESTFVLKTLVARTIPYQQDFESQTIGLDGWTFSATSTGFVDVVTTNNPRGSAHLKFDQTSSGTKTAVLLLNLADQAAATNLTLDLWVQTVSATSSLSAAVSGDGTTYYTVNASLSPALAQYTNYTFDLLAALSSAGIALDDSVYLRFSHTGSNANQEVTIDDVRISNQDLVGPRVTSQVFVDGTMTVTFGEAIDPASFTAGDVVVKGPTGLTLPLLTGPTPSADQRTYTLSFDTSGAGSYSVQIGPDVRDLAGNPMNQDNDGLTGETSDWYSIVVQKNPPPGPTFPYQEGFAGGTLALPGMTYATTGSGTTVITTDSAPRSDFHIKFGQTAAGTSTSQLTLMLDLASQAGATDLTLDFWLKAIGASSTLSVQVSGNGTSFSTVSSSLTTTLNQYTQFAFDLDAALSGFGVALDSDVYVRFIRTGTAVAQEMTLDDLRISNLDLSGPRVTSHTTTATMDGGVASITVNFSEPIDLATFTAADVTIIGADGVTKSLLGEPTPSADNNSFTLRFIPTLPGYHTLHVGPDVRDLAGNQMNQDSDGLAGETSQDRYQAQFDLGAVVAQTLPYVQGFNSGSFESLAGWTFTTNTQGPIRIDGAGSPYDGTGHLRFKQSTSASQTAILKLDLSAHVGATDLVLDYWQQLVTSDGNGAMINLLVSADGMTWRVIGGTSTAAVGAYSHFAWDLDNALFNIALDSDVYISFTQYSGNGVPEVALDQVRVRRGPINYAPRFIAPGSSTLSANEDTARTIGYSELRSAVYATDDNGDLIRFRIENVFSGTLTMNGLPLAPLALFGPSDVLQWTPPANNIGSMDGFRVRAFDGDLLSGTTSIVSFNVQNLNDAPLLNFTGELTLPTQAEDTHPNFLYGITVQQLLRLLDPLDMVTDVDPYTLEGIAVLPTDSTNGTWEYSLGGSWSPLTGGGLSRLLSTDSSTAIRFVPRSNFNGDVGFSFRAWDGTSGANGILTNITSVGDTTAYSTGVATTRLTITPANDPPQLNLPFGQSLLLGPILEDDVNSNGMLVADLIASLGVDLITDIDAGAVEGLAIPKLSNGNSGNGVWQYSLNNGQAWTALNLNQANESLLLAADDRTRIRFVPAPNYFGQETLTVVAWDRSVGVSGDLLSNPGATSAFSTASASLTVKVRGVGDTPVVSDTAWFEDGLSPSIVIGRGSDGPEVTHVKIQAITGGTLFRSDGVTPVVEGQFLPFAAASAGLRFLPATNYLPQGSFQVAASEDGVTLAAQSGWATCIITIIPKADPPQLPSATTSEDTISAPIVIDRHPTDGAEVTHFRLIQVSGGVFLRGDGTTVAAGEYLTYAEAHSGLRFQPNPNFSGVATYRVAAALDPAYPSQLGPATDGSITVLAVNDPPAAINVEELPLVENAAGALVARLSVVDIDAADSHTYVLSDSRFEVVNHELRLKPGMFLDHEAAPLVSLTIQAIDSGGLQVSRALSLAVGDVNEAPSDITLSNLLLNENEAAVVGAITVSDPELLDTHTLTVSDARFEIVGTQLRLKSGVTIDFEQTPSIELTLTATDAGGLAYSKTVILTVRNVNESPSLQGPATGTLAENLIAGMVPGAVFTVQDPDAGDTHTWQVSDTRFEIVAGQLRLKTGTALDFEAHQTISLTISVADAGGLSATGLLTLTVLDQNEAPAAIQISNLQVAENAAGAVIGTITATDPDAGDTITYAVDDPRFEVVNQQLRLRGDQSLDFETVNSVALQITATDRGGLSKSQSFAVGVEDRNEAPTALTVSTLIVAENSPGASIGAVLVSDLDAGEQFTYAVSDTRFTVVSGQLRLKPGVAVDFEAEPSISLDITATDRGGLNITRTLVLSVTNVNEAPIAIQVSNLLVAENALGAVIGNVTVTDPDAGELMAYSVSDPRFEVVNHQLRLRGDQSLNFEATSFIAVQITATDRGGLSTSQSFTVDVEDRNEAPTALTVSTLTVAENSPGASIGAVTVSDPDAGEQFTYTVSDTRFTIVSGQLGLKPGVAVDFEAQPSISLDVTATDRGSLSITRSFVLSVTNVNEATSDLALSSILVDENLAGATIGAITITDPDALDTHMLSVDDARFEIVSKQLRLKSGVALNFEQTPSLALTITATDVGGLTYSESVTLTVRNVNEAPAIQGSSSGSLAENVVAGVVSGAVLTAQDPDAGDTQSWQVSDSRFEIVAGQLRLKAGTALDFEAQATLALTITVTDALGLSAQVPFALSVLNQNEAPTAIQIGNLQVAENVVGALIGDVVTTDPDAGDVITYQVGYPGFEIVNNQLRVRSDRFMDFEAVSFVSFVVVATDSGGLRNEQWFVVHVEDRNEAPTELNLASLSLPENTVGADLGAVQVSDPDAVAQITYTWSDPRFTIANHRLQLRPGVTVDFEAEPSIPLDITATDQGGLSITRSFVLGVTDQNESPTAIQVSSLEVAENAPGAVIGDVSFTDPDAGDIMTYSLNDPRFEVVNQQLRLRSDQSLDFETASTVAVQITATDRGGLSTSETFKVTVANRNEAPSALNLAALSLPENTAGAVVGAVNVSDLDASEQFSYTVSDPQFTIIDGQLRLLAGVTVDFETQPSIPLDITATDRGGLSILRSFVLSVTNVNEPPTGIVASLAPVTENQPGVVVGQITATDPDSASPFTFSTTDPRFEFVGDTLRLKPNQSLNYEAAASLSLPVTVRDAQGLSATYPVTIQVTDAPDRPADLSLSRLKVFNDLPGAWVSTVVVADEDRANNFSYVLSDSRFEIRGGELYLKPGQSITEAAGQTINLSIEVHDAAAGGSASKTFALLVEDAPANWTNGHQWAPNRLDVDADGQVTPLDALLIIIRLNAVGPEDLVTAAGGSLPPLFFDTSGDNAITPLDPLEVIIHLNSGGGAGESEAGSANSVDAVFTDPAPVYQAIPGDYLSAWWEMDQEFESRKATNRARGALK